MLSHSIDFTKFKTQEELLLHLQKEKYWFYGHPKPSTTLKENFVRDRIDVWEEEGGCLITKFPNDTDPFGKGLNARTELRCPVKMSTKECNKVSCQVVVPKPFKAEFLQIMGTLNGRARPLVQLEIRDEWLCVRYGDEKGDLRVQRITQRFDGTLNFEISFRIKDFISINMNGNKIFNYRTKINLTNLTLSYGIYCNQTNQDEMNVVYKFISINSNSPSPSIQIQPQVKVVEIPKGTTEIKFKFV